jgi:6-phosphogluconolactonase (cycloisomerase 2 family)
MGSFFARISFAGVVVSGLFGALQASAAPWRAYIGTYTPQPGSDNHGEGIYLVDIDPVTGALGAPKLAAKTLSPSWITFSPDRKFLYAVVETDTFGPAKSGAITAFAVDAQSGALKQLNTVSSQGAIPAYISVHPSGKFLLAANYNGGTFSVTRIKPDGSLGEATDVIAPTGPLNPPRASDNPPGQFMVSDHAGSRAHMIAADPTGQYVIGDDAGRDQIYVWKLDLKTGKLAEVSRTASLAGSAPRHFVFTADGKRMYQLQEQDSQLALYDFAGGHLMMKGPTVSTLPNGYAGSNTGSELLISKDGKHLYSGNRTQDSIAVFAVGAQGAVTRIANVPTEADQPRSLALDPSGRFLYSLNQRGDSVTSFRIDAKGVPRFTGKYLPLGSPATMVFLP